MLAARYRSADEPFALEDVDVPDAGPNDVLVEMKAASICGSDVHYLDAESDFSPRTTPLTLGHEGAGVVAEVGENVDHVEAGDRVVVHYVVGCGDCRPCTRGNDNRCRNRESIGADVDGTFAEYVAVPGQCAVPMGEDVPFSWGSIAGCAVSTAYHALQRARLRGGDDVVVFGAGGVGLHAVMWAEFLGAGRVFAVDLVPERLDAAADYGADVTLDPREDDVPDAVVAETDGWGADVAVECSGAAAAMKDAIAAIDGENRFESGTAVSVGLQEESLETTYWGLREGQLLVSGDHTRAELATVTDLVANGRIDLSRSVARHEPLSDIEAAVERVAADDAHVGRVVVDTDA